MHQHFDPLAAEPHEVPSVESYIKTWANKNKLTFSRAAIQKPCEYLINQFMLKLSENRGRWSPVCFSFFGLWHTFRPPWRVWKPLSGVAGQKCTVCQISQRERELHTETDTGWEEERDIREGRYHGWDIVREGGKLRLTGVQHAFLRWHLNYSQSAMSSVGMCLVSQKQRRPRRVM